MNCTSTMRYVMDVDIMLVRVLLVIQNMPHPLRGSADSILSRMLLEKCFIMSFY